MREGLAHSQALLGSGQPRILFLPSGSREGSDLLRCFNIAEELKRRGFNTAIAHKHLKQRQRERVVKLFQPHLLFVKGARHPLNRREQLFSIPYVVDLDDADFHDPRLTENLEELAREARGFIAGSRYIARWAKKFNENVTVVWTGSRPYLNRQQPHRERGPIITWAQAAPLKYPAELAFVAEVMQRLAQRRHLVKMRFYGVGLDEDAKELETLIGPGIEIEYRAPMPYKHFVHSLQDVAIGLSPIISRSPFSNGKSFGKILGYLDAKVPVICSDEADHAKFFVEGSGVVSNDPAVWVTMIDVLLDDADRRQQMADLAFRDFIARLSLQRSADLTEQFFLEKCLGGERSMHGRPNQG